MIPHPLVRINSNFLIASDHERLEKERSQFKSEADDMRQNVEHVQREKVQRLLRKKTERLVLSVEKEKKIGTFERTLLKRAGTMREARKLTNCPLNTDRTFEPFS